MTTTESSCAECGTRAEPGQSFCDGCGAVLSWTDRARAGGERVAAAEAGQGPPAADRAAGHAAEGAAGEYPARPALPVRAVPAQPNGPAPSGEPGDSGDSGDSGDEDTLSVPIVPSGPPAPSPAYGPGAGVADPVPTSVPAPAPAQDDAGMDRARQLLVPVADPAAEPAAPAAVAPVLPGQPVPQRPQAVRAPGLEQGMEGGVSCPWCATPNGPERHFCVRCAMPMTRTLPEESAARRPWWRRLLNPGGGAAPWAGDRPRLRRTFDRVLTWLGAAVVLAVLVVLAVNVPQAVQATKDHFAKRSPIAPDRVTASRSYAGHPAKNAFDKWNNTWWGPGVSGTGQGQWIEATFDQPTRLLDLVITSGVSTHADQLQTQALPHRVTATVTTPKGTTFTRDLTLDQVTGPQRIAFRVGEVSRVRLTIDSAYFPDPAKQVAVAEVEFFGPSSRS